MSEVSLCAMRHPTQKCEPQGKDKKRNAFNNQHKICALLFVQLQF